MVFRPGWSKLIRVVVFLGVFLVVTESGTRANHRGSDGHGHLEATSIEKGTGHAVPGAEFRVFLGTGKGPGKKPTWKKGQADQSIETVVSAFQEMIAHRTDYRRFDEALTKHVLNRVIIEPQVFNRDGKEFAFLVARTPQKGRVNLLINAAHLERKGYFTNPDALIPVLAREFQWVISKADTTPRRKSGAGARNLAKAPILSNKAIRLMSGTERVSALQALFQDYLVTVDDFNSLKGQPYFQVGTLTKIDPATPRSTTRLYDIRVREALQYIVGDPYFLEHMPKAVRNLLNGKIWHVSFANIPSRDWATRTRVLPRDKAIKVGGRARTIQPAKILVNVFRVASPEDPFYEETGDLPMGSLSKEQLARVIAMEIENNIIEKSMRGHTAADEVSSPN